MSFLNTQLSFHEQVALPPTEVQVWHVSLTQPPGIVQRLRTLLGKDEVARADRFHFDRDRNHYIVARGTLRTLLSCYLQAGPTAFQFEYTKYNKPLLSDIAGQDATLKFNVSHSGEAALIAFTYNREIGVDIEKVRPLKDGEEIAKRFFSEQENKVFRTIPPELKEIAFFTCWTRKEAYIKAHGEGLSLPLDQFDVTLIPRQPAKLLSTRHAPHEVDNWRMEELFSTDEYIAALAVEGDDWLLKCGHVESVDLSHP